MVTLRVEMNKYFCLFFPICAYYKAIYHKYFIPACIKELFCRIILFRAYLASEDSTVLHKSTACELVKL